MNIQLKEEGQPKLPEWVASQEGALWTLKLDDGLELVASDGGTFAAMLRDRTNHTFWLHSSEGHGDAAGARDAAERWLLDWTHKVSNTVQILRHYRAAYAAKAAQATEQALKHGIARGGR